MSAAYPDRSKTMQSEDDFTSGEDTSETQKLFQERLAAWKHTTAALEDYVHSTEKMQHTHAKEYEKVLKTVAHPLKEGDHFSQNIGGIGEMFENIRTNTQGISNSHAETARTLKSTVLPIFERLDNEIKTKQKELKKGVGKGAKAVDKARSATQKHVELLSQHATAHENTAGRIDPSNDPYILHRGVYHRLNRQIQEENSTRQEMLGVQESFSQFEAHIVTTIQQGIGQLYTAVAQQADRQKQQYANMVQNTQGKDPLFEWGAFVKRNNNLLMDPTAGPRTLKDATFPGQNHSSTQALIQGSLERKQGLLKKYESSHYAVTPARYLHEFKSDDDLARDPSPEMSLWLPECQVVGPVSGNSFSVKGKDVSSKLSLSGSKEYEFRARTEQDAENWWRIIREVCSGTASTVNSGANSPIGMRKGDRTSSGMSSGMSNTSTLRSPVIPQQEENQGFQLVGGEGGRTGKVVFSEEEEAEIQRQAQADAIGAAPGREGYVSGTGSLDRRL